MTGVHAFQSVSIPIKGVDLKVRQEDNQTKSVLSQPVRRHETEKFLRTNFHSWEVSKHVTMVGKLTVGAKGMWKSKNFDTRERGTGVLCP